ncbi:hypothetical protein PAXRUDRAFT_215889, partial [Paxillus rubicundulus Ve08.2h10]
LRRKFNIRRCENLFFLTHQWYSGLTRDTSRGVFQFCTQSTLSGSILIPPSSMMQLRSLISRQVKSLLLEYVKDNTDIIRKSLPLEFS